LLDIYLADPSSYRHAGVADISGGNLQPSEYLRRVEGGTCGTAAQRAFGGAAASAAPAGRGWTHARAECIARPVCV